MSVLASMGLALGVIPPNVYIHGPTMRKRQKSKKKEFCTVRLTVFVHNQYSIHT